MARPAGRSGPARPGQANQPSKAEVELLDNIAKWALRESALREQFSKRMSQVDASRREECELRESLRLLTDAYEECRKERYDIVSDFMRQYKATFELLIKVGATTHSTITELKDQQELARIALDETGKEKDHFLALKDKEIDEQSKRIEEMDEEFHIMLEEMQRRMEKKVADAVKAAKHAAQGEGGDGDSGSEPDAPPAAAK